MKRFLLMVAAIYPSLVFAAPKMQLPDRQHDFGGLLRGQQKTRAFSFQNTGTSPLVILGIHAECGCTAVVTSSRELAPGAKGEISVTFDSTHFAGNVHKSISILTNESRGATKMLTVKARVNEEIGASPPIVDFGTLTSADSPTRLVTISQADDVNVEVIDVFYNDQLLDVTMPADDSGRQRTLRIQIRAGAPAGALKETVYLITTSSHLPKMPIPVRAIVESVFSGTPDYLEFGTVASDAVVARKLHLQSLSSVVVTGLRSELFINGVSVEHDLQKTPISLAEFSADQGGAHFVTLHLANPTALRGALNGVVYLQSSEPSALEIPIRVFAFLTE